MLNANTLLIEPFVAGLMSVRRTVPPVVPSEVQTSVPVATVSAKK